MGSSVLIISSVIRPVLRLILFLSNIIFESCSVKGKLTDISAIKEIFSQYSLINSYSKLNSSFSS